MDITKIPIIQITQGTSVIEINQNSDIGIASGTLKLDRIIVNSELKFGELYSDKFEVEIYNIEDDLSGCPIQLFIEENNVRTVKFTGVIESSKRDRIGYSRKIIAYDWVHYHRDDDISTWWNSFWTTSRLSATIKEIRDSLISYMGFTGDSNTYVNDSITIPNNFNLYTDLKFHTIISMLCELQGTLPHIAEDGSFKFITINNTTEDITGDYEGGNCTWEDYTTNAITGVGIYSTSDDLSQLIGTNANVYRVAGNLFALTLNASDLTTLGTNLLSAISTIQFVPNTIKMKITNFDLALGQRYNTEHGYGYVMSNAISGICMVEQTLKSVAMGENLSETVSTRNDTMIEGAKMSKFEQTIDGFQTEVSQATQTANTALTRANGSITTDTLHYLATPLSSGVTTETAGWTTTPQSMTPTNKYLWTYHTYTYADAHTSDTTPVITGVYGEDGQQGQTGPQGPAGPTGADGLSITEVTSIYYASDSSTAPSAPISEVTTTSTSVYNTWTKGVPALTSTYNKLYTCDQVKYTNNTFAWTTPVLNNAITTVSSEITQLASEIVLKVDNNGKIVKVALDGTGQAGTVTIKGDNIQLDGNVTITSGFVLNVGTIQSANYAVDPQTGVITNGIKINLNNGRFDCADFNVNAPGIHLKSNNIYLSTTGSQLYLSTGGLHIDVSNEVTCQINPNNFMLHYAISGSTLEGNIVGYQTTLHSNYGQIRKYRLVNYNLITENSIEYSLYDDDTNKRPYISLSKRDSSGNLLGALIIQSDGIQLVEGNNTNTYTYLHTGNIGSQSVNYATTAGSATTAKKLANYYTSRPTSANLLLGDGSVVTFRATNSMTTGKPADDSHILHLAWDNTGGWDSQVAVGNGGTTKSWRLGVRSQNSGTWGKWIYMLDDTNYTSMIKASLNLTAGQYYKIGNRCALSDLGTTAGAVLGNNGVFARSYSNTNAYVNMYAAGFSQQSSRLVKENVNPITDEEAKKLLDIDVVSFDYIEAVGGQKNNVGMIAEDMLDIYPNLVQVPDNYSEEKAIESIYGGNNTETLALDYAKFTPYLIKMIQMQQQQINELKKLI